MKYHILFLLLCLGVAFPSHAQDDCHCPRKEDYAELTYQLDTISNPQRKRAILKDWELKEDHPGCKRMLMRLTADHVFREGKIDSAKIRLAELLHYIQGMGCADSFYLGYLDLRTVVHSFALETDSTILVGTSLLNLGKRLGKKDIMSRAYFEVGNAYFLTTEYSRGLPYIRKAIQYVGDIPKPISRFRILNEPAKLYTNYYGYKPERVAYLDSAAFLANQAIEITRIANARRLRPSAFECLAKVRLVQGRFDECLIFLDSAAHYLNPNQGFSVRMRIAIDSADVYAAKGRFAEAVEMIQAHVPRIPSYDPSLKRIAYRMIYEHAKNAGNPVVALDALERYKHLQDSIFTAEKAVAAREFEARYKKVEQDAEIRELARQQELRGLHISRLNTTIFAGALFAVAVIVTVVLWYRQRLLQSEKALHETEQRLNRARINPHVFFNMMATLQNMSLDPEQSDRLPGFLARYSRLMRITLETTYAELIPLEMELQYLEDYLALQSLRIPGRFTHKIEIDPSIDPSEVQVPSLIFQPLAENSIEHGFQRMQSGGQLTIRVERRGDEIVAMVDDNGQPEAESTSRHEGFPSRASQIIEDRITLINSRLRRKAQMALRRMSLTQGYRVEITIPKLA
ncbi:MAG: histidine kinase [Bacteroidia bacterium]